MSRILYITIALMLLQCARLSSQESLESKISDTRSTLVSFIGEQNIVGLAITLSYKDSIVWSEGFGYSDLEGKTPIEPNKTLFRIASLAKPITASVLMRLEEEELISVENSVYTYVPEFPKKKYDLSLLELATHTSGIRHYKSSEKENRKPMSLEAGLSLFKDSKLKFEPGTEYLYSSYGYNLLGVAMEKATGKSFETLLKTYLTEPLNMSNTMADPGSYDDLSTSGFFMSNGKGKIKEAETVYMAVKLPSGGMLSTSEDLVTFGNAIAYQRLLQESTQNKMFSQTILNNGNTIRYGIGWGIKMDQKGRKILSHSGGNTGSVCRLIVYPDSKLTLAVVSNTFGIDWLQFMRIVNEIPNKFLD